MQGGALGIDLWVTTVATSVLDVAKYILGRAGEPMTTMKLQKLCYYAQAWHLVWRGKALFPEEFEAWANGPVCRPLFAEHRDSLMVRASSFPAGDPAKLTAKQQSVVDDVLKGYLRLTGSQLNDLTHGEKPWMAAAGRPESVRSQAVISTKSMRKYYSSLNENDDGVQATEDLQWPDSSWTS